MVSCCLALLPCDSFTSFNSVWEFSRLSCILFFVHRQVRDLTDNDSSSRVSVCVFICLKSSALNNEIPIVCMGFPR